MSSLNLFALLGVVLRILAFSVDGKIVNDSTADGSYYSMLATDLNVRCNITNIANRPTARIKGAIHFWPEEYSRFENIMECIGYVNCDEPYHTMDYILSAEGNSSAIILYSNNGEQCDTPSNIIGVKKPLFLLSSVNDKRCNDNRTLENENALITPLSYEKGNGTGSPRPARDERMIAATYQTAMIVLYSVSGVVLGMFFLIVIINLIKNRVRSSSRSVNGNHNDPGNGIAKSVLDSFPVYLFTLGNGVNKVSKTGDVSGEPALESLKVVNEKGLESTGETEIPNQIHSKSGGKEVDIVTDDATNVPKNSRIENSVQIIMPSTVSSAFNKITDEQLTCPICLDDFESGEELRILPCHHQYHTICIDPWLLNTSPLCPMCKTDYKSWNKEFQTSHQEDGSVSSTPPDSSGIADEPRNNNNDSSPHIFPHFRWIRYLAAIRMAGGRRRRDRRARVRHSEGEGEVPGNQQPQDNENAINDDTVEQGVRHGTFRASI